MEKLVKIKGGFFMNNGIDFVVGYESVDMALGLSDGVTSKMIVPVIKTIEADVFSKSMEHLLNTVTSALEQCSLSSSEYTLGDVELSLTISANGEVSILSAAQIAGGAEAAINVTLKRKG